MEWISKKYNSLNEFMVAENKISSDFPAYKKVPIKNLDKAAEKIKKCCFEEYKIFIIGDYDVDGISSSIIMSMIMKYFGVPYKIIIPKRFTDGYGISENIINTIISEKSEKNIVVTIDNGITAIDHFKTLKEEGFETVIIDHHEPLKKDGKVVLPNADIIVDPHIEEDNEDDYCAAGLAFKLAEALNMPKEDMPTITVFAMFATIADIVSLTRENREIVREGLRLINEERNTLSANLKFFLEMLYVEYLDEEGVAYNIGPAINAPGRLVDDGAQNISMRALFGETDFVILENMLRLNKTRKSITEQYMEICKEIIKDFDTHHTLVIDGEFHEGIIGILAGKLAQKYQVPVIVLSNLKDSDFAKGSARTAQNESLIDMLRKNDSLFVKYGGHEEAAGLTIKKSDIESLRSTLSEKEYKNNNILFYDLDVKVKDLNDFFEKQKEFAPFGNGNRKPLVKVSVELTPRNNETFKEIANGKYAKLYCNKCDVMLFDCDDYQYDTAYEKWKALGMPNRFEALAYVTENIFKGNRTLQLMVTDIKSIEENEQHKKSDRDLFLSYFS